MASTSKETTPAVETPAAEVTIETAIEQAKRAFSLKKYEQAVDYYATALELITNKFGDDAPETADLYFSYGKALLENAISQNSVLGKEQREDAEDEDSKEPETGLGGKPILSFSGDAEDDDPAVDLFETTEEEEEKENDEEGDDAEPEDDFNAAWEVLDLARAIYDKQSQEVDDEEIQLKLADTYIALGDVSLETEKFDQAITDYEAGLNLKLKLLPISSRHIAEAHYKLSMVLDLTSGRLSDAIVHVEKALESVEHRLAELRNGLSGQLPPLPTEESKAESDPKGKGKATATRLVRDDLVQKMSKTRIKTEIKELSELRDDLALKVEELKTLPADTLQSSAPALAAQALDKELNSTSSATLAIVNDLTSIVKKKKKPTEDSSASKRKAEGDAEEANTEKKARLEEANL